MSLHASRSGASTYRTPGNASLVLVSFPHQLVHALAAIYQLRMDSSTRKDSRITVFAWSYDPFDHVPDSRFSKVLRAQTAGFPHIRLKIPGLSVRLTALAAFAPIMVRAKALRNLLRMHGSAYGDVYYSHDASGDRTAQAVMQAYPDAARICYGDPPGFIYPPLDASIGRVRTGLGVWLKSKFIYRGVKELDRDRAIVTLDMNGSRSRTVSDQVFDELLPKLLDGTSKLVEHALDELLSAASADTAPYLLLMSNFSESGLCIASSERDLYVEIIERHVPKGATVILKPHSASREMDAKALGLRLRDHRILVSTPVMQTMPIELMPDLIDACTTLSVSSSSALLCRLMKPRLRHVLDDGLISRHFKSQKQEYMRDSNACIRRAMDMLDHGR